MNAITQSLLAGAALVALATTPAVAGNIPAFHVTALHAYKLVSKTKVHDPNRAHLTYTFGVYTYVPASDLRVKTKLFSTFTKWNSNGTQSGWTCGNPKSKIVVPKKSTYGTLGAATETYSFGCASGPTVLYGDTYKLTSAQGEGKTDHFVSSLISKWENKGVKYKGTMNLDVSVAIGE